MSSVVVHNIIIYFLCLAEINRLNSPFSICSSSLDMKWQKRVESILPNDRPILFLKSAIFVSVGFNLVSQQRYKNSRPYEQFATSSSPRTISQELLSSRDNCGWHHETLPNDRPILFLKSAIFVSVGFNLVSQQRYKMWPMAWNPLRQILLI
jgi:hypothetical protein